MSRKSASSKPVSTVSAALLAAVEPLVALIDENAPTTGASNDAGHELPSRQDAGLRILLSNLCRTMHQQIYGFQGSAFKGVKDMVDRAESSYNAHIDRYVSRDPNADITNYDDPNNIVHDPTTVRLWKYMTVTQARLSLLQELLDSFKEVHIQITGDKWTDERPAAKQPSDKMKADRAAIAAMIAKAKANRDSVTPSASAQ